MDQMESNTTAATSFPSVVPNAVPGFKSIPTEVVTLVFSYFSIKETYMVQTVCKQWFTHLWSNLRALECVDSKVTGNKQKVFRPPSAVTSLTSLGLPYYSLDPTWLVECIKRNTSLSRLDIYGCEQLHSSDITSALPLVTALTSLNFSVSHIQDSIVECVAENLPNLKKFAFARCFSVTQESVKYLTSLTKLTDLWLSEVIDDWGCLKNHLTQLTKLVSNNPRVAQLFDPNSFFDVIDNIIDMNPPSVGPDIRLWINYSQRELLRQLQAVPGMVLYLGNAIAPIQRYSWEKQGSTHSRPILDYLIQKNSDINIQSEGHATPLMIASCVGNDETVKLLIDAKAKPNCPDRKAKRTPLMQAITLGHFNVAKLLVALPELKVSMYDTNGQTALHMACQSSTEMFKVIFGARNAEQQPKKFDLSARDNKGFTPLFMACRKANSEIVKGLLGAGADVNALSEYGTTPLWELLWMNSPGDKMANCVTAIMTHCEVMKVPLKVSGITHVENQTTLLTLAIGSTILPLLEKILPELTDAELKGDDGKEQNRSTGLLEACRVSKEATIMVLNEALRRGIKLDIDVSHKMLFGVGAGGIITPLLLAVTRYDCQTVELLLKCGANPDYSGTNTSEYALVQAILDKNSEMVQLLLRYNASTNVKYRNDSNILMVAISTNDEEMVVLAYSVNPELVSEADASKSTVLHYAVRAGSPAILDFLLTTEAAQLVNAVSSDGKTALVEACSPIANGTDHAHASNLVRMARSLVRAGAKALANPENTPMMLFHKSMQNAMDELIALLKEAGDDVLFVSPAGETMLHLTNQFEIAQSVIISAKSSLPDFPAYLNQQREDGATALNVACVENKNPEIIKLLVAAGANPNLSVLDGRTPLHVAAATNNKAAVGYLLSSPTIDLDRRTNMGLDPLSVATPACRVMILAKTMADSLSLCDATAGPSAPPANSDPAGTSAPGEPVATDNNTINAAAETTPAEAQKHKPTTETPKRVTRSSARTKQTPPKK